MNVVGLRITARWNRNEAITTDYWFSDLPVTVQHVARDQGSDGSDIRDVYHLGTVYLVVENLGILWSTLSDVGFRG